jgi:5S rRNA maturation endonuclease (ribonuclease M5)
MNNTKNISIKLLLAERGILPKQERPGYGMYLSPYRDERTPSFKVDYNMNVWFDHGSGEGGSIIDLVMKLERCDFRGAMEKLENSSFSFHSNESAHYAQSTMQIDSVVSLQNAKLIDYLQSKRAINIDIAKEYCREVHYSINGKPFFAVGFQSDAGGWELRNEYFKGSSSPKGITTIGNGSNTVMVFEGFVDFLSYLSLKDDPSPSIDTTVLNSVANLAKAIPFLQQHKTVHAFLDNDGAGKRAIEQLRQSLPNSEVVDQSAFYRNHKDLNEYLTGQRLAKSTLEIAKPQQKEAVKIKPRGRKM